MTPEVELLVVEIPTDNIQGIFFAYAFVAEGVSVPITVYHLPRYGDVPTQEDYFVGNCCLNQKETNMEARNISKAEAVDVLTGFVNEGLILLEPETVPGKINLDGWNPVTRMNENGNVAGVVVRYWPSGRKGTENQIQGGAAPDRLDPRNAMALVMLCQYLNTAWGITDLYHAGISGDTPGGRNDCHGQGRAVDFIGVRGALPDGTEVYFTVYDDWGKVFVPGLTTANGDWPPGTGGDTDYRLQYEGAPNSLATEFFRDLYFFMATHWQDRTDGPEDALNPTAIGRESRFIMHPDHPTTSPGTPHGREAHKGHIHLQIGVTGSE